MRRAALFISSLVLVHLACNATPVEPGCSEVARTYDSKDVLCTVAPAGPPRRLEFIVRFSGGHDDTSASIRTSIDGQPLACDEGSKKELFAEDGNVSLHCRFSVDGPAAGETRLRVVIRWSHAEFTGFELLER